MYSGYDDLIKKFKEKFSSNVWLTERQIKSFFSRARVAAKNKIHEDELDRKKEEWKQELLKKKGNIFTFFYWNISGFQKTHEIIFFCLFGKLWLTLFLKH